MTGLQPTAITLDDVEPTQPLQVQVMAGRFATTREQTIVVQRNVGIGLALDALFSDDLDRTARRALVLQIMLGTVERQAHTAGMRDVHLEAPTS